MDGMDYHSSHEHSITAMQCFGTPNENIDINLRGKSPFCGIQCAAGSWYVYLLGESSWPTSQWWAWSYRFSCGWHQRNELEIARHLESHLSGPHCGFFR
jgi:hypothetical protein